MYVYLIYVCIRKVKNTYFCVEKRVHFNILTKRKLIIEDSQVTVKRLVYRMVNHTLKFQMKTQLK